MKTYSLLSDFRLYPGIVVDQYGYLSYHASTSRVKIKNPQANPNLLERFNRPALGKATVIVAADIEIDREGTIVLVEESAPDDHYLVHLVVETASINDLTGDATILTRVDHPDGITEMLVDLGPNGKVLLLDSDFVHILSNFKNRISLTQVNRQQQ